TLARPRFGDVPGDRSRLGRASRALPVGHPSAPASESGGMDRSRGGILVSGEGARACDTCGATDVPLERGGRLCQCARCKVRSQSFVRGQSYEGGTRESLVKSAEAMFRAMCERGLRAVEILEAAVAVGERPITDFLALVERGDAEGKLISAERDL